MGEKKESDFELGSLTKQIVTSSVVFTTDEERAHFKAIKRGEGDSAAMKNEVILRNVRLVLRIAKRYTHRAPLEDNFQEGIFGLAKAYEKFDPNRGYKFSTYASWWIRQFIIRAIQLTQFRHGHRIPVHAQENVNKVHRLIKELSATLCRDPKDAEIVEAIVQRSGCTRATADKLLVYYYTYMAGEVHLDRPLDAASDTLLSDTLTDTQTPSPDAQCDLKNMRIHAHHVRQVVDQTLVKVGKERRYIILCLRAGFDDTPHTLESAGVVVGLTRERVRQLEAEAYHLLRERGLTKAVVEAAAEVLRSLPQKLPSFI